MGVDYGVEDGKLSVKYDRDEDGQPSISLDLNISEAIKEAFDKGQPVEGVKVASIEFEGMDLKIKLDTDQDGQSVLDLKVNLPESLKESGVLK